MIITMMHCTYNYIITTFNIIIITSIITAAKISVSLS